MLFHTVPDCDNKCITLFKSHNIVLYSRKHYIFMMSECEILFPN